MSDSEDEKKDLAKQKRLETLARAREIARQNRLNKTKEKKEQHQKELYEKKLSKIQNKKKVEESEPLEKDLSKDDNETEEENAVEEPDSLTEGNTNSNQRVLPSKKSKPKPKVVIEEESDDEPNVIVIKRKPRKKKQQQIIYADDESSDEEKEVPRPTKTKHKERLNISDKLNADFQKYFNMR